MSGESDIKVSIGAEDSGLQAAFERATEQGRLAAESIKSSFEGLTGTFQKVQGALLAFSAALAGGEGFREAINSSVEWTEGAKQLSMALGISTEKASTYEAALRHLGIGNDVLISATEKLSKQIYTNGAAFDTLGVKTKGASGEFLPIGDILEDVTGKLRGITDPIARNIAGMQVFGKGWAEVRPILKITGDQMAEAQKRVEALGLVVGPAQEAQVKAYKEALRDVGLVGTSVSAQMGGALLPALTQVGVAFSEHGASVAAAFAEALKMVAYIAGTVWIELQKMGRGIAAVGAAAVAVLHGDLSAAKSIMSDLDADITRLNKSADSLWDNLHKPPPPAPAEQQEKVGGPFDPKEKNASQMAALEERLAAFKANYAEQLAAQGTFGELSKSEEKDYWSAVLATANLSAADQTAVRRKIADDGLSVAKEQYANELAALQSAQAQYKGNLDAKLALAQQYAAKVALAEGSNSKGAQEADAKVLEIQRELEAQRTAIAEEGAKQRQALELFGVQAQENAANQRVALHQETETQLLAQEQTFENQRYAIRLDALAKEKALIDPNEQPEKVAQMNAQIEALTTSHLLKMQTLASQSALEQNKDWQSMFSKMQSGFATAFASFLKGSATIGQTIRSLFTAVGTAIADTLAQMAAKNIATMVQQAAVGNALRAKEISADAAKAASGAYAAIAGIPYVGPVLAPLAAATAYAGVMAFDSAEGGYDIPGGVNPVVQTHQREMILPQKYADTIRDMANNGGGGGGDTHHHWNVNTMDAASFKKFAMTNKGTFADAVHSHLRSTGRAVPAH